jgi:cob(I)alamin adenosyltransferase
LKEKGKLLPNFEPEDFYQMGTGFTWNTQDKEKDQQAFDQAWPLALEMLSDDNLRTVMLDEITYMLASGHLQSEDLKVAL